MQMTKLSFACSIFNKDFLYIFCVSQILLGNRSSGVDCVVSKSKDVTTKHIKLSIYTFTMAS